MRGGLWLGALLLVAPTTFGESLSLPPVADTTLHELFLENNLGGHTHVAIGTLVTTKPDGGLYRTRGLYRFDLGQIPKGSTITAARLRMPVVFSPGAMPRATYGLHRVTKGWGEGNKSGNTGAAGTAGEATWVEARSGEAPWANPGGDFLEEPSTTVQIDAPGVYLFPSTVETVADAQSWISDPGSNHGWLLRDEAEAASQTAKRFGSREAGGNRPTLELEYTPPPAEVRVVGIQMVNGRLQIQVEGGEPNYLVESTPTLDPPRWEAVGPISATLPLTAPVPAGAGFYRVVSALQTPVPTPTARYRLEFKPVWSAQTHPANYPLGAHWSSLVGGVHSARASFWQVGSLASPGIKDMAELGATSKLVGEVAAATQAGTALGSIVGPSVGSGSGTASLTFTASLDHPLVTITSMLAPSPDWFVGLSGYNLLRNGVWLGEASVPLELYDAGTDSGTTYRSPDQPTNPRAAITAIDGFPARVGDRIQTFGTITLTKQ